jgi:hypothetical protein
MVSPNDEKGYGCIPLLQIGCHPERNGVQRRISVSNAKLGFFTSLRYVQNDKTGMLPNGFNDVLPKEILAAI